MAEKMAERWRMRLADAVGGGVREGAPGSRSVALDVFRGVCVAGMILVTDPGTYAAVYPQLLHAEWHGATAADMIFPGFLFAVGAALPLALRSRLRRGETGGRVMRGVCRRTLLLIAIGLLLNAFPQFAWRTLRLPGVLQRIALCYFVTAGLLLGLQRWSKRRRSVALGVIAAGLLVLYGVVLERVPVPGFGAGHLDTLRSLPAYVDRAVFTVARLWPYGLTPGVGVTFDPEGLLSTVPAIASTLLGVLAGEVLLSGSRDWAGRERGRVLLGAAVVAVALIGMGLALDAVMPIIKKLWTPSFALLSSGVSLLGFLLCVWAVEVRGVRRGLTVALVFGTNAIAAFAVSGVLTSTLDLLRADGMNWHAWGYSHLFLPSLSPVHASLLYAVCVVAVNALLLWELYRRRIFLRV